MRSGRERVPDASSTAQQGAHAVCVQDGDDGGAGELHLADRGGTAGKGDRHPLGNAARFPS